MSNEYKDWERDKIEEEKQIVAKYPFLRLRDIDGTIDTESKFPLMSLDDFYFIQVKEKFNFLRCYSNGAASQEVEDIISKYEHIAHYICTKCGRPATCETQDYLASFCDDCWKDHFRHEHMDWIEFKPYYRVTGFAKGEYYDKTISFEDEWNRYIKE